MINKHRRKQLPIRAYKCQLNKTYLIIRSAITIKPLTDDVNYNNYGTLAPVSRSAVCSKHSCVGSRKMILRILCGLKDGVWHHLKMQASWDVPVYGL